MSKLDANTRVFVASVAMLLTAGLPISALAFQEIVETTKDAEIRENSAASNFGGGTTIDVRSQRSSANVQNRRSILGFDLAEFVGCTVDSATFDMFLEQIGPSNRTHDVNRLKGAWAENTVTWTIAGALTLSGSTASTAIEAADPDPQTVSWTVTSLAQAAIDDPDSNELTLRVKDSAEQTATGGGLNLNAQYTSREGAAVAVPPPNSFAPRLVLELTCDECELWADETAWADGDRYENPGNWATYTEYAADTTVTLYAGQTYEAGTVNFAPDNGDVAITITLNSGFRFADVPENVKVENYASAPSGNPSPGGFSDKDYADPEDNTFEIIVPLNNFYGVHVDVERCADDDVPDA